MLTALPNEGFRGKAPKFPLPARQVRRWEFEDNRKFQVLDGETTEQVEQRELELWRWAWTTPQACAWSIQPWRVQTIAMWVRTFVLCESDESSAADKGSLHRFADQIGLTPAGLKENGWAIAADEVTAKADSRSKPKAEAAPRRLRATGDGVA